MRDSCRFKSQTQSYAFTFGNTRKGQIDCGKGEKSGIAAGISNYLQLLCTIQCYSPNRALRLRT